MTVLPGQTAGLTEDDSPPKPTPQKCLVSLLEYIEQVEKLNRRPTFTVPTAYFCRYEDELRGLPSLEFDVGDKGDEVWLRVPRIKETDAPQPDEKLKPWVVLHKSPDKLPQLREQIVIPPTTQGSEPTTAVLEDTPNIKSLFEAYVRGSWNAWAEYERPCRKTISFYNELFKLYQTIEAEGVETPVELVWGIGMALWQVNESTRIHHPLITQAVAVSLDPMSLALEVHPRDTFPVMEIDPYLALDNSGVPAVEAAWKHMLEKDEKGLVSPFDESSFRTILGAAAGYLDANGSYWPELRKDAEDRTLPKVGPTLTVTDTWVLFARNRSSNFLIDDLARLRKNLEEVENVPGGPAALVSALPDEVEDKPSVFFRGLSYCGAEIPAGSKTFELYFPKPYNEEQVSIVQKLEVSEGVVVQGPPGTGKTHTIANIVCHYLANGKRVLVTSKGEPALSVLREQIPEGIRALTVALLTNEKDGMRQFEHAIETIASEVSRLHPGEVTREIEGLTQQVDKLHATLAAVDQEITKWAKYHTEQIRFRGREWMAEELARYVVENEGHYSWLPDLLEPRLVEPKFTNTDIASIRKARLALGEDLTYLGVDLPVADTFPDGQTVSHWHEDRVRAKDMAAEMVTDGLPPLAISNQETLEKAQALFEVVSESLGIFDKIYEPSYTFTDKIRATFRSAPSSTIIGLNDLLHLIHSLERERQRFIQKPVKIPDNAELDIEFVEAVARASQGKNPLGVFAFRKSELKANLATITISGLKPEVKGDWSFVLQLLDLRKRVRAIAARWNATATEFQLPQITGTGPEMLRHLAAFAHHIIMTRRLATEFDARLPKLVSEVFGEVLSVTELHKGRERLAYIHDVLSKHLTRSKLDYAMNAVSDIIAKLVGKGGTICGEMREFLTKELGDSSASRAEVGERWSRFLAELRRLASLRGALNEVGRVTSLIEQSGAAKWAGKLRTESAVGEDRWTPMDCLEAWQWRCASTYLQAIDGREKLRRLQVLRRETEEDLARTYQRLVEKKTWIEVHRNSPASVKGALQAFLNAIKHIGKGTGIRAVRYRKEARDAMYEAYRAVPCWIMPQWRVSESLPAEIGKFDLVIIDEASQSDLWALPSLVRGKKLMIVGDDKQVSPDAIGLKEDDIASLKNRLLREQVHGDQMTPEKSIYDLAKVVFAGEMVMLREHFRCVAPIIEFSKREFYNHQIRPLRVPKASERLDPPLVDVFVRGGTRRGKVNEPEARAIVDEIRKIISDPRFDKRTIGVVSLLGIEQAHRIFDLIREQIDDEDIIGRKITVGDARTFQGKERDVIMLSMVATPEDKTTSSGRIYEQRFNVAASRARDRMYLFRSVEISQLSKNDLKAMLIGHFQAPFHQDPIRARDLRSRCQSGFEREMFDVLVGRGYCITPQVPTGGYYIDLVVEGHGDRRLAIECDGDQFHGTGQWAADMARQRVLERAGWTFWRCFASSFTINREAVLDDLFSTLAKMGIGPMDGESFDQSVYTEHREVDPLGVAAAFDEESAAGIRTAEPTSVATQSETNLEIPEFINRRNNLTTSTVRESPSEPPRIEMDSRAPLQTQFSSQFSEAALEQFLNVYGLKSADHRGKKGALWVFADNKNRDVVKQLRTWGFRLKPDKGWWRT